MTKTKRDMPATVWRQHDGTLRISNKYPTPDRTVTPDDADFPEVSKLADAWDAFLVDHNAANGAPTVLSRTKLRETPVEIGTVELTAPHEFTQYFEYAAYWVTILAQPQTVTLRTNGDSAYYGFEGTVIGGGRNVSAADAPRYGDKIGDTYTVSQSPYTYDVDDSLDSDQTGNVMIYTVDPDKLAAWIADRQRIIDKARQSPRQYWTWNYDRVRA